MEAGLEAFCVFTCCSKAGCDYCTNRQLSVKHGFNQPGNHYIDKTIFQKKIHMGQNSYQVLILLSRVLIGKAIKGFTLPT